MRFFLICLIVGCADDPFSSDADPGDGTSESQSQPVSEEGGSSQPKTDGSNQGADPDTQGAASGDEPFCDGFDDNQNGLVDEGCACALGENQPCYPGDPETVGVGPCDFGTQSCVGETEFSEWGPCTGAVVPADEICGNGVDDNCDGSNAPCTKCELPVAVSGDCLWVACPSDCPYPIGCDLDFSGGDSRGCVGYATGDDAIYLQEGDACGSGEVIGTIICSATPGVLTAATCTINKCNACYSVGPSGCAGTSISDPGCGCDDPCNCGGGGFF